MSFRPRVLGVLLLLMGSGCTQGSIQSDARHVRQLTRIEHIARVEDGDVDPAADADARQILQRPLDEDGAVRVALLNNRELRATLREMGVVRGRMLQAGLLPNPVVEAELLPERDTRLELRLEYDISSAVLAPLHERALEPALEAARFRAAAAVVELGYRVRVAFYGVQAAEQRLGIAQSSLQAHAAGAEAARAMWDAGNVPDLELATERVAYERARVRVARLELDVLIARERLQRLLGAHGQDTTWKVRAPLDAAPHEQSPAEHVETRALQASLELRQTRQRLEYLARQAGVATTAGWLPAITVDVHALHGTPEGAPSRDDWRFGGGVALELPFFDRNQGTSVQLHAEFDALMERYHGLAIDLRSAAREAVSRVSSAHARARHFQEVILPAQERVTAQTLLQYNAMQLGVFHVLSARREQLNAEFAYVDTLAEYWSSVAALNAILAGTRVSSAEVGRSDLTPSVTDEEGGH